MDGKLGILEFDSLSGKPGPCGEFLTLSIRPHRLDYSLSSPTIEPNGTQHRICGRGGNSGSPLPRLKFAT